MGTLDIREIKDFLTGEARRRKEEEAERARIEEADDIKSARNPYLPEAEYLRLVASPYSFVRIALAHNRNIPYSVIELLAKDPDHIVIGRVRETFSVKFGQEGINPSSFYFYRF